MAKSKKKYKQAVNNPDTVSEAPAAYGIPSATESSLLSAIYTKPVVTSKDVFQYSTAGLNEFIKEISKTLPGKKPLNIPSQDYVDRFIDKENLKIDTLFIDKKHDHLLFVLNNGATLQAKISKYPLLNKASEKKLKSYSLYAGGTCVEWEELDEDLSLRGLLKDIVFDPLVKALKSREGFVWATE